MKRRELKRKPRRNGNGEVVGFYQPRTSTKLQELEEDFIQEFLDGATDDDACAVIGVSVTLFRSWMTRGRLYEEALQADEEVDSHKDDRCYRFRRAVLRAKAKYRARMRGAINDAVKNIINDTKGGWLALEVLARRDSKHWGRDQVPERGTGEYTPDETFL